MIELVYEWLIQQSADDADIFSKMIVAPIPAAELQEKLLRAVK